MLGVGRWALDVFSTLGSVPHNPGAGVRNPFGIEARRLVDNGKTMTAHERTRITYRYERLRAVAAGVVESAATSFLLLIALRGFEAGAIIKGIVAGGASTGLMLS